jgi:catechol 2,3-dioxygenase-like lactoylglutathione lyase family enzyme
MEKNDMPNLSTTEIKAFVPARDFELSKRFYQAVGFDVAWSGDGLAYLRSGDTAFLLQDFFVQAHADNFMMHMLVESVDDWHRHLVEQGIGERFGVALGDPADRPWGIRDFTLHDPSGVLWRIGSNIERGPVACPS